MASRLSFMDLSVDLKTIIVQHVSTAFSDVMYGSTRLGPDLVHPPNPRLRHIGGIGHNQT